MSYKLNKKIAGIVFVLIGIILILLSIYKIFVPNHVSISEKTEMADDFSVIQQENDLESEPKFNPNKENTESNLDNQENFEKDIENQASIIVNESSIKFGFQSGETVFDVMQNLKNQNEIDFTGKNFGDLGFFVESINGIQQEPKNKKYWRYYINGQEANIGISNYQLKPQDSVEWKLEIYE